MKFMVIAAFCSFSWSFLLAEDEINIPFRPWIVGGHIFDNPIVPYGIFRNHPQDTVSNQQNDLKGAKDAIYYSLERNDADQSGMNDIRMLGETSEVLGMTDGQFKPVIGILLQQYRFSKTNPSESSETEKEPAITNSNAEGDDGEIIFRQLPKDVIWSLRQKNENQESKISQLGKRIWKKKDYFQGTGVRGIDQITDVKKNGTPDTPSFENPLRISDTTSALDGDSVKTEKEERKSDIVETSIPIESTSIKSTSIIDTLFSSPQPKSVDLINETSIVKTDTKIVAGDDNATKEGESPISESLSNIEMVISSLEKEQTQIENEPIHGRSFLQKSSEFQPVRFFPSSERNFRMPSEDASAENKEKTESVVFSPIIPIKESAGSDLFPSSIFEEKVRIPFFTDF